MSIRRISRVARFVVRRTNVGMTTMMMGTRTAEIGKASGPRLAALKGAFRRPSRRRSPAGRKTADDGAEDGRDDPGHRARPRGARVGDRARDDGRRGDRLAAGAAMTSIAAALKAE